MQTIHCILVPTDLTPHADEATDYAVHLALAFHAEVHLLHVLEELEGGSFPGLPNLETTYAHLRQKVGAELSERLSAERQAGIAVHQAVRKAPSAAAAILDYANEHHADLIVMGTRGRSGADRFLIGATAERVVRHATVPVLTVGPKPRSGPAGFRRILVPLDLSAASENVLSYALEVAARANASITLLHVLEPVVQLAFDDSTAVFDLSTPHTECSVRSAMERLYRRTEGPHVAVHYHVAHGRADREITRLAQRDGFDLIVQGGRGVRAFLEPPIGSVAERVVRSAPCPVLTVKQAHDPRHEPVAHPAAAQPAVA